MPAQYSLSHARSMQWPVLTPVASAEAKAAHPGVALDRPVCVVGARVLVHLPLGSQQVSKAQALIVQEIDGVYLRDLASLNQTHVNDRAVCEARLGAGDLLQLGPFKYRCESGFDKHGEAAPFPRAEVHLAPDGLASRQFVPVEQYTFLIGSRNGCDLMLRGAEISLAHAVIFVRDGRHFLRDLSSMTGTFVNDQVIRQVELHLGDQIRIGSSRMEFHPVQVTQPEELRVQEQLAAHPQRRVQFDAPIAVAAETEPQDLSVEPSPHMESADHVHLPWDDEELELDPDADTLLMGGSSAGIFRR